MLLIPFPAELNIHSQHSDDPAALGIEIVTHRFGGVSDPCLAQTRKIALERSLIYLSSVNRKHQLLFPDVLKYMDFITLEKSKFHAVVTLAQLRLISV